MTRVEMADVESLAAGALDWLLVAAEETTPGGLAWPSAPGEEEVDYSLYQGTAGIVPALLEGSSHFGDDRYGDAALRAARAIAAAAEEYPDSSLYGGLTGMAVVLRAVCDQLGDAASGVAADRLLETVRSRFDGTRWGELFELLFGNAGVALGALACGDVELAVLAVEPYLRTAEETPHGVQWAHRTDVVARLHHISHGALGIAYALAAVGHAADRSD
ncbi:MAG: lanthionine synthetase LanC family protein, partial [Stackebrandtia sp.]